MATTTPNFGWDIPQSTDLVKDGATAIAALGNDIDTSMVDLKGGTTGQVLSKASNTDMDFTWVSSAGDIEGVTAGAGLSGGGTSGTVTLNLNSLAAGRNAVINGGMDIWQRGTSISIAASTTAYTADRLSVQTGTGAGTTSRQATGDTTNLPNIQYCARIQRNSGQTGTTTHYISYNIETIDSIKFAGQTVTLSFYARRGANYSATSNALLVYLISGTGTDQNLNAGGYTGAAYPVNAQTATLTTTWQRFTFSGTVAASATQLGMQLQFTPTGTAGAADYFEITGVQIELGSSATPFSRAGGTIQGELAACQRYYWRSSAFAGGVSALHGFGTAEGTGTVGLMLKMPSTMRVTPTAIDYASLRVFDGANLVGTPSSVTLITTNSNADQAYVTFNKTSSFTQYRPYFLINDNTTSGYIGFTAEL